MSTYPAHSKCVYTVTQGERQLTHLVGISPVIHHDADEDMLIIPRNFSWYAPLLNRHSFPILSLWIRHTFLRTVMQTGPTTALHNCLRFSVTIAVSLGTWLCVLKYPGLMVTFGGLTEAERGEEGFIPQKSIEKNRIMHGAFSSLCDVWSRPCPWLTKKQFCYACRQHSEHKESL